MIVFVNSDRIRLLGGGGGGKVVVPVAWAVCG